MSQVIARVTGIRVLCSQLNQRPASSSASIPRLNVRSLPPLFPPATWNVHEATVANQPRTNNECESWNNAYRSLVGHSHPSVWKTIDALQQDQAMATTAIQLHQRGQPPAKRVRRHTIRLQERLHSLCVDYRKAAVDVAQFLRAVGHTIRLN